MIRVPALPRVRPDKVVMDPQPPQHDRVAPLDVPGDLLQGPRGAPVDGPHMADVVGAAACHADVPAVIGILCTKILGRVLFFAGVRKAVGAVRHEVGWCKP